MGLFTEAFREGLYRIEDRPAYRDPWTTPKLSDGRTFGESAPVWQRAAWKGEPYTNPNTGVLIPGTVRVTDRAMRMAAVGGKGSGKTHLGGMRALHLVQKYPGGRGMIVANSYSQAFGSAAANLVAAANEMGLRFEFYTSKVIDGLKFQYVYYFPDFDHIICVLSFENIALIEGSEWDWLWCEEIQDCQRRHVETAISRLRRGVGDHSCYFAGMPDDAGHWMYEFFDTLSIPLYEPSLRENIENVGQAYLDSLRSMYRGADLERYVNGARISLGSARCLPHMDYELHVRSEMALRLSQYDRRRPLYIAFDFNVNPMCVTLRQPKEHLFVDAATGHARTKIVLAQIDEFELFGATTGDVCDLILEKYGDHVGGGIVLGDSTGNRADTRSPGKTDWTIIRQKLGKIVSVRPGVALKRAPVGSKRKRGEDKTTYHNPPTRDRVNALDRAILDADGDVRWTWLPESRYPSGGSARSCSQAKWTEDGRIDDRSDRDPDKRVARTHFFDAEGYLAYFFENDGRALIEREQQHASGLIAGIRAKHTRADLYGAARTRFSDGGLRQHPTDARGLRLSGSRPPGGTLRGLQ